MKEKDEELEAARQRIADLEARVASLESSNGQSNYLALVENLPDLVARFDPELRHVYVSSSILAITGLPAEAFLGKTNLELAYTAPPQVELWDQALRRVFETGNPETLQFSMPVLEGIRQFEGRLLPERDKTGRVAFVLSITRDVTELRNAYHTELEARQAADRLREATFALTQILDRRAVLTTLLERLHDLVPFDRASVMLVEDTSRVSVRAIFDGGCVVALAPDQRLEFDPADHPLVDRIVKKGETVIVPNLAAPRDWGFSAEPHATTAMSWMGVPLFARNRVAGLFTLATEDLGFFEERHIRLAEVVAAQASVAVENANLFEQLQDYSARMKILSRRLVDAQENERRHISRELHDEAGQDLVSLRYGLRLLERNLDAGSDVRSNVKELVQRTDKLIDGMHRLASDLRPASLDHLGLDAVLRQYTRTVAAKSGLTVRYKARGFTRDRLPTTTETALYRVVQEAVNNVMRHAKATRIDILLELRGDRVVVMIEDDGVGFEPDQDQRVHYGLLGIRERAEALDGTLTVESNPGAGTTILVEVSSADPHSDR